jgi:haloacetate dehalogenase
MAIDRFAPHEVDTDHTRIFACVSGSGPPVLLLHGFPQTHLMWRHVAPRLAQRFAVVCADLRGYGRSGCPESARDHQPYSKRAMAGDMMAVMQRLGFARFSVVGHDRGGRVAYRMALDYPDQIDRVAILDVVPTAAAWERADARLALAFWPWSLLAQPAPLPETILTANADAIVEHALGEWGTPATVFSPAIRREYVAALRDPAHAHAICEEYRAAATIDRQHDHSDLAAAHRISAPLLVLWSRHGALGTWYADEGGPLGIWRPWSTELQGRGLEAGHFFPEERPDETAQALSEFLCEPLGGHRNG